MAKADDIDYGPNIDTKSKKQTIQKTEQELYYIQNGYVGNAILWWGIESKGYTTDITKAGKFTKDEVYNIIVQRNECAWPCKYIDKNKEAHKMVIDSQYLHIEKKYFKQTIDFNNK